MTDYVVLGGGNVKEVIEFPDEVRRGHNRTVVEGGYRLWEELPTRQVRLTDQRVAGSLGTS